MIIQNTIMQDDAFGLVDITKEKNRECKCRIWKKEKKKERSKRERERKEREIKTERWKKNFQISPLK